MIAPGQGRVLVELGVRWSSTTELGMTAPPSIASSKAWRA